MGHSSDPGLTPCWGHYYIYVEENLSSTQAGEKARKQKKTVVFVIYIYINWAAVKGGTIYCPVHGHLQVNDRRTTQTRIGQVIANRQTLENKTVVEAMSWLRHQRCWLARIFWIRRIRIRRIEFLPWLGCQVYCTDWTSCWRTKESCFDSWHGRRFVCTVNRPQHLWILPSFLCNGYRGSSSGVKAAGVWSLMYSLRSK